VTGECTEQLGDIVIVSIKQARECTCIVETT